MGKNEDVAGKMLGWSLGSGIEVKSLKDLLQFPCDYNFKAVGVNSPQFVEKMVERVTREIGRPLLPTEVEVKVSRQGKYTSVTLNLRVSSFEEVLRVYAAIKEDDSVKYIL